MNRKNPKVDDFIEKASRWQEEFRILRSITLGCGLTEELKWYQPCYTFQKSNVVIISGFKDHCILGFFKGALLDDPKGILIRPGENTQSGRQIRFTGVEEIREMEPVLKAYIFNAIDVEKEGLNVVYKKTSQYEIPEEFKNKLDLMPELKTAFESLTPGRQRAYLLHFSAPKQSKTRTSRVEKCIQNILNGEGLNEQYSKRR